MMRHGEFLHAAAEVCSRIAAGLGQHQKAVPNHADKKGELCVADSEVAQFCLALSGFKLIAMNCIVSHGSGVSSL